jgi:hypothetical protein
VILNTNDAVPGQPGAHPVGQWISLGTSPGGLPQNRLVWGTLAPGFAGQSLYAAGTDVLCQGGLSTGNGTGLIWASPIAVWQVGGAMTAVAGTASLTSLLGSGSANQLGPWVTSGAASGITVPAYLMNTPGSVITVDLVGTWGSTNTQPTINFTVTLGGVTIMTGTAAAISAAQTTTGGLWSMSFSLTTVAGGSSGTLAGVGLPVVGISYGTGTPGFSVTMADTTFPAVNLTAAAVLGVNAQWSVSSASNTIVVSAGQAYFMPSPLL